MPSPGRIGELPSAHDIKRLCKVIYALLSCKYSNMHSSIITQIRMTQQRLSMNCIPQTVDGSHTCTIINLFIVLIPWTFLHRDNCTAEESWIYTKLDWHYSSRKQNYILGHTFILCLFYMLNLYFMTRAAFLFYVWYSINTVLTSLRKKGGGYTIYSKSLLKTVAASRRHHTWKRWPHGYPTSKWAKIYVNKQCLYHIHVKLWL